jgi:hypothetical protein
MQKRSCGDSRHVFQMIEMVNVLEWRVDLKVKFGDVLGGSDGWGVMDVKRCE